MLRRRTLVGGAALAVLAGVAGLLARTSSQLDRSRGERNGVSPPPDGVPAPPPGLVLDVTDFGAVGDGRADDSRAIRDALTAANDAGGGTLFFPAGTYSYWSADPLRPSAGVTLAGQPGLSTIRFDNPSGGFAEFCVVSADDVTIDGLVVRRVGEFPAVLVSLGSLHGFTLSRTMLVGNQDVFPDAFCHGMKLPESGAAGGIRLVDSTITTMQYGLLQTNASTAITTGISVERCTFTRNRNTDLEFNSPVGSIRQVRVDRCLFADHDAQGFAVGLAHVSDATVRSSTFDNYPIEAVHIEDYSENVTVQENDFVNCGLRDHSHVQVISGSRGVRIRGNSFRALANTNTIYLVNALPGGDDPTPGGRAPGPPSDVAVQDNDFECAAPVVPVYFQAVEGGAIVSNRIVGESIDGPDDAFHFVDDADTTIADNEINGQVF